MRASYTPIAQQRSHRATDSLLPSACFISRISSKQPPRLLHARLPAPFPPVVSRRCDTCDRPFARDNTSRNTRALCKAAKPPAAVCLQTSRRVSVSPVSPRDHKELSLPRRCSTAQPPHHSPSGCQVPPQAPNINAPAAITSPPPTLLSRPSRIPRLGHSLVERARARFHNHQSASCPSVQAPPRRAMPTSSASSRRSHSHRSSRRADSASSRNAPLDSPVHCFDFSPHVM